MANPTASISWIKNGKFLYENWKYKLMVTHIHAYIFQKFVQPSLQILNDNLVMVCYSLASENITVSINFQPLLYDRTKCRWSLKYRILVEFATKVCYIN